MVAAPACRRWQALLRGGAAGALLLIALGGPTLRAGALAFAPPSSGGPRGSHAAAARGRTERSPAAGSRPSGGLQLAAPAACLAGVAAALALARRRPQPGRGGCSGAGRAVTVARRASDEEKLLKLVGEFPSDYDAEDIQEVSQQCKKMRGVPGDAFQQFVGDWKAEWSSRSGSIWGPQSPTSLKLRSFGALPPVTVQPLGSYFRVLEGDVYERVDVFTVPEAGGAQAAMVLAGSWSTGTSEGDWGRGAPRTRCGTQFKTVRLTLSAQDPEASKTMLEEAGLGGCLEAGAVDTTGTYVDLDYISDSVCVTKDEAGTVNVLTRLSEPVPFNLD